MCVSQCDVSRFGPACFLLFLISRSLPSRLFVAECSVSGVCFCVVTGTVTENVFLFSVFVSAIVSAAEVLSGTGKQQHGGLGQRRSAVRTGA